MAFFKVKVDGTTYELERLTLGDARILKRDFGLTDMEYFSPTDPDQIVGLLALAISKSTGIPLADAVAQAEDMDVEMFETEQLEDVEDPTPAASGGHDGPVIGDPETIPSTHGDPSTPPS